MGAGVAMSPTLFLSRNTAELPAPGHEFRLCQETMKRFMGSKLATLYRFASHSVASYIPNLSIVLALFQILTTLAEITK